MPVLSRRRFLPLIAVTPLLAGQIGCRSAGIKDAFMARDSQGRLRTKTFQAEGTEIHTIIKMVSGREDVVLILKLKTPANGTAQLESTEIAPGQGEQTLDIKLAVADANGNPANKGPWDVGDYEITVLLDGELESTLTFSVLPAAAA